MTTENLTDLINREDDFAGDCTSCVKNNYSQISSSRLHFVNTFKLSSTNTHVLLPAVYPTLLASLASHSNYTLFADDHGMLYIIDTSERLLTQAEYKEISYATFQTKFLLYTRNNRKVGEPLIINDNDSVKKSSWNSTHPTCIITHGWRGDIEAKSACALIRDAYLSIGEYNVILVDWSKAAGNLWYPKVAWSVPLVAERVTQLIDFLQSQAGLDPSKTKVVGHSLGGHVIGLAARNAKGDIVEAVALDPARPLFDWKGPGERIDRSDAARVQVIHTSILGLGEPIGEADFYPNGGNSQPGCGIFELHCKHARSYEYYAESILNPTGFRAGKVFMGGPSLDPKACGVYVLETADRSPFALG